MSSPPCRAEPRHIRALLNARSDRLRLPAISVVNDGNVNQARSGCLVPRAQIFLAAGRGFKVESMIVSERGPQCGRADHHGSSAPGRPPAPGGVFELWPNDWPGDMFTVTMADTVAGHRLIPADFKAAGISTVRPTSHALPYSTTGPVQPPRSLRSILGVAGAAV
jgi:hypothetical protein